jgi:hypothetical protein
MLLLAFSRPVEHGDNNAKMANHSEDPDPDTLNQALEWRTITSLFHLEL